MEDANRHRRTVFWRYLRFAIGLGLGALVLYALNGQRNDLVYAAHQLGNLQTQWVVIGIVGEILSFISLGRLQRQLLLSGDVTIGTPYATELSLAQSAISNSLPGGPAFSFVYLYRQYRKKGASSAVSVWVLVGTLVCEALALSLVATAGVAIAIQEGASYNLIVVTLVTLAIFAGLDAVIWQRKWLVRLVNRLLMWSQRHLGRPRRDIAVAIDSTMEQLSSIHLNWHELTRTVLYGMAFWVFDCVTLATSFAAVGASIPWRGLLLAYGAGQLAANLPITPGGLGVVEGSLTIAIVAFDGTDPLAFAAVLLYRIITFWGPLVVGWISWTDLTVRQSYQRSHSTAPERRQTRVRSFSRKPV